MTRHWQQVQPPERPPVALQWTLVPRRAISKNIRLSAWICERVFYYSLQQLYHDRFAWQLAYKRAAYIYENFAYDNPSAAQLAIWEVVFEGLSGGSVGDLKTANKFYGTNINAQDLADAQNYVAAAMTNGENFSNTSAYKLLVSPSTATSGYYGVDEQDFLVRVPEPGVLTLLGLGLVALGITRRRSK